MEIEDSIAMVREGVECGVNVLGGDMWRRMID